MGWVLALGLVGVVVVVVQVRHRRLSTDRLAALAAAGRHREVLDHHLPSRPSRDGARMVQTTSAVLTGRYAQALDLLAEAADDGSRPPATGTDAGASLLRAVSLMGLGRYGDVGRLLGDRPAVGSLRTVRARAAVELGDDDLAELLLADPRSDPLEEAGRLRLLGDLRLRRGRLDDGELLIRTARASYAGSVVEGSRVDVAVCTLLLARAKLAADLPGDALPLVNRGLEELLSRPDHEPGFAEAHCIAAIVHAELGDGPEAGRRLAIAQDHASRCQSPALDAEVTRSAARVALALGDGEGGRRLLDEAIAAHVQLGAAPVVAELRARRASFEG